MKEKYNTCLHAQSVGEIAVHTTPGCPRVHNIKGVLAVTKGECRRCRRWKPREERL